MDSSDIAIRPDTIGGSISMEFEVAGRRLRRRHKLWGEDFTSPQRLRRAKAQLAQLCEAAASLDERQAMDYLQRLGLADSPKEAQA